METLILSCSTGGGHNSAGLAMKEELENRGHTCIFMDPYSLQSEETAKRVGDTYINTVKYHPNLFGLVYKLGQGYELLERIIPIGSPVLALQKRCAQKLKQYLSTHHPDVIICTHPFPGMMISLLKKECFPVPPSFMVATDYTCIPFETQAQCDYMVIPTADITNEFLSWGLDPVRILPFGIPVRPAFEKEIKKPKATLGFPSDQPLIVLSAGSMGSQALLSALNALQDWLLNNPTIQVLALCGGNKTLQEEISQRGLNQVRPIGFTSQMPLILAAADILITKPGGLSITEAAVSHTPLLLVDPIPGCEDKNAAFFQEKGMAKFASQTKDLPEVLEQLLQPSVQEEMVQNQKDHIPCHAASCLASFIEELLTKNVILPTQKDCQRDRLEQEEKFSFSLYE